MGNGLWVGATFRAAGVFARMEAGGVLADVGVARDESDKGSAGMARATDKAVPASRLRAIGKGGP